MWRSCPLCRSYRCWIGFPSHSALPQEASTFWLKASVPSLPAHPRSLDAVCRSSLSNRHPLELAYKLRSSDLCHQRSDISPVLRLWCEHCCVVASRHSGVEISDKLAKRQLHPTGCIPSASRSFWCSCSLSPLLLDSNNWSAATVLWCLHFWWLCPAHLCTSQTSRREVWLVGWAVTISLQDI